MSKRTDAIRSMFTAAPEVKSAEELSADNRPAETPRRSAGAVNAIRSTFADIERENEALRAAATSGEQVIEVEAGLIDPSPFPDRFTDADDNAFSALKASIAERGQAVPVLLRAHPTVPGRYQTAYGHRRVKALGELGQPVRALIRALSDEQLAAAQGIENSARADLSFIERAAFALRLERAGCSRVVIQQALTVDKAEASKLIAVASAVPPDLIAAIGRAPRTGRPRWQELAEAVQQAPAAKRVRALITQASFQAQDSDNRFLAVLSLAKRSPEVAAGHSPTRFMLKSAKGDVFAKVTDANGASRIVIDHMKHEGFADFVVQELPALFERYASLSADTAPADRRR
ncbi:MAG: plasmid partitioning protein RepB [Beijerinckiaceae bacterium]